MNNHKLHEFGTYENWLSNSGWAIHYHRFFFLPFFDAFTFSCSEFSWYSAEVFEHQHLCSIPFYIRQTSCLQVINVLRCMRSVHSTFRNKTSQDYTTWGLCVDAWTLLSGQNYSNPVYFFFFLHCVYHSTEAIIYVLRKTIQFAYQNLPWSAVYPCLPRSRVQYDGLVFKIVL